VDDPSGVFLTDRLKGAPGSAVVPVVDGHRPLLVEMQALVVPSKAMNPRRAAQGIDGNRLAMLLAVLERRCGVNVLSSEVYVSVVGGVRVTEPGADLGIALSVASSVLDAALDEHVVVFGEVGLAGELRQVAQLDRRLDEASRLGYRCAVVPASVEVTASPLPLIRAASVAEAMHLAGVATLAQMQAVA
jgi:DNA repair protein RadA/Sms